MAALLRRYRGLTLRLCPSSIDKGAPLYASCTTESRLTLSDVPVVRLLPLRW